MRLAMWVDRDALEATEGRPVLLEFGRAGGRQRRAMVCAACGTRLGRRARRLAGVAAAHAEVLRSLLRADDALMAQLRAVRALGLASWCIGAGAVRNRVWDARFGQGTPATDVDVAYFDARPWSPDRDDRLAARLAQALPGVPWEVVHQGHVHRWSSGRLGRPVAPFASLEEGLSSWPETATAVGVALRGDDTLDIVAPLGLADLMDGVLRRNPRCPDANAFDERVATRRWLDRWPGLRVASEPATGQAPGRPGPP